MLYALNARYSGATIPDVIILLREVHYKTNRDSIDLQVAVDELGDLFFRRKAINSPMTDLMQGGLLMNRGGFA